MIIMDELLLRETLSFIMEESLGNIIPQHLYELSRLILISLL